MPYSIYLSRSNETNQTKHVHTLLHTKTNTSFTSQHTHTHTFQYNFISYTHKHNTDGSSCSYCQEKEGRETQEEIQAFPIQPIHESVRVMEKTQRY